jgi:hypothetical protein
LGDTRLGWYLAVIEKERGDMAKKRVLVAAVLSVGLLMLSACSLYTPLSQPSSVALQLKMDRKDYTILGTGIGISCSNSLLGFPSGESTYKEAVNQAVQSRNGDLLIQSSADLEQNFFPLPFFFLWSQSCVTVQGLVVKLNV